MNDKIGAWQTIPEMSDVDLLKYISGTEAQIRLRQRALAAAEAEARTRRLVPNEKMTRPDRPRQVIGREET